MITLTANNISYTYKTKHQAVQALQEVSFTASSGEFCVLIGKSGSGKTTLLSLLAGLDMPTEGSILINGNELFSMDIDLYRRNQMSLIYQNYNLFPLMTVQENVAYPLLLNQVPLNAAMTRAAETLDRVGLGTNYLKRLPSMLSGGEQQRVAIARSIANRTELVLADEPTGNLDAENSEKIVELLKELAHKENCCVVVVTHDLEMTKLADRVFTMKSGILTEDVPCK